MTKNTLPTVKLITEKFTDTNEEKSSLLMEENFWITVFERQKITEVYPDKEKDYFLFQDKWSCGTDEFPYTD